MSGTKEKKQSLRQTAPTFVHDDLVEDLRSPTTSIKQISTQPHRQGQVGNCFAQSLSTTIRGIINWIKQKCRSLPDVWSQELKNRTPDHENLLLIFTGLYYGEGSSQHISTIEQIIKRKYRLEYGDEELISKVQEEKKKFVCSNARYLKWLFTGSLRTITDYIKTNYDFDTILTQNKDIVIRELQKDKGSSAIIGISLLSTEHERFKSFIRKINRLEIDRRSILKKADLKEIGPQSQSTLVEKIKTPFLNYRDKMSDRIRKKYYSHVMTIIGFNLDHETPYWEIKNSYGPSWADGGFVRIEMDAFDDCTGISQGYIDRLGSVGRNMQSIFDPYERCSVSYVIIKPSDNIIESRCNEETQTESKKQQLSESEKQQLRDEMSELGIKLEMGTTNPIDDERYSEISRLLYSRGGKRKIPFSKIPFSKKHF